MSATSDELVECAARVFCRRFDGVVTLETEDGATIFVDGREDPPRVSRIGAGLPTAGAGHAVWRAPRETLLRVLESERQFAGAFVSGRLRIAGDMSVAARVTLGSPS